MKGKRLLMASGGVAGGLATAYLTARAAAAAWARRSEDFDADAEEVPGDRLYLRGRCVHVTLDGEGPPLLMIHGFAASAATFRRLAPLLNDRLSLIAPDLPGFGFSERAADADHSHEANAALLLELLDRLDIARVAVLGHSIGAAIALRLATTAPERVTRIVLAGGPGQVDPVLPAFLRPAAELIVPALAGNAGVQRWLLNAAMAPESQMDDATLASYLAAARVRGNAETLVAMLTQTRHGPPPELSQISAPALVITGERDRYFPPRRA